MFMIFAETHTGDIVQILTWTKDKADGIHHMNVILREKNKTASKIWAEKINKTETA